MLNFFWNFFIFIFSLGILILIHEFGHFIVARYFNVAIERFSIGFGKILLRWQDRQNTEYVISAIPLGGYVKMLDEQDNKKELLFNNNIFDNKPIWQRSLIIFSGPMFNLFFSVFLYCCVFMMGITDYRPIISDVIPNSIADQIGLVSGSEIKFIDNVKTSDWDAVRLQLMEKMGKKQISIGISTVDALSIKRYVINLRNWIDDLNINDPVLALGIVPFSSKIKPILTKIYSDSAASKCGLQVGDQIIAVNNELIGSWQSFMIKIKNNPGKIFNISIKREEKILDVVLIPDKKILDNGVVEGYIGVLPQIIPIITLNQSIYTLKFFDAFIKSIEKSWQIVCLTLKMLGKLIIGDIGLNNVGGPISIAQGIKVSAEKGLIYYLMFLALISINLSVFNLLPLPVLDGGCLLFLIIERIKGKRVSVKIQELSYRVGCCILLLLMCLAIFNDVSRLI